MEYEHFLTILAKSTTFDDSLVDKDISSQLFAWMQSDPNLPYQFSNQIISNMPSPRISSYEHSDFSDIQDSVLDHHYPITQYMGLF